jgi:hypothetical protein
MSNILVTTGVMRSDSTMNRIVVEFENTSASEQEIIVQVLNWNLNTPTNLLAPTLITIPVGQIRVIFIPAVGNFAYEVRARIPADNKVIVTSFAETANRTLIHGNTVLFPDFNIIPQCDYAFSIPSPQAGGLLRAIEVSDENKSNN